MRWESATSGIPTPVPPPTIHLFAIYLETRERDGKKKNTSWGCSFRFFHSPLPFLLPLHYPLPSIPQPSFFHLPRGGPHCLGALNKSMNRAKEKWLKQRQREREKVYGEWELCVVEEVFPLTGLFPHIYIYIFDFNLLVPLNLPFRFSFLCSFFHQ